MADSKACLTCHDIPSPAFTAHGAPVEVLEASTRRLIEIASNTPAPVSAHVQSATLPTQPIMGNDIACATCHQEHKGAGFKLDQISNEQCRSCHVVKFDTFEGNHPRFETYPFERRTRVIYDHASHFGKHFPETAKKDPTKAIPSTCATCHDAREDVRVMAVAPFDRTCATCHLEQIIGSKRASGPKGVAFLSLPGLDLATLKKRKISIGEWPDASEAQVTPFMKVMISRSARGRQLIKAVEGLNLQSLGAASDDEVKAVGDLAWETKRLIHDLIKGRAADVLGALTPDASEPGGLRPRVADLTASIPRDVILGAQQQWLPNLSTEMANRPGLADRDQPTWSTTVVDPSGQSSNVDIARTTVEPAADTDRETASDGRASAEKSKSDAGDPPSGAEARPAGPDPAAGALPKRQVPNPQTCLVRVFGQCIVTSDPEEVVAGATGAAGKVEGEKPGPQANRSPPAPGTPKSTPAFTQDQLPPPMRAGLKGAIPADEAGPSPEHARLPAPPSEADRRSHPALQLAQAQPKAADQKDDLLFPTDEEVRAMKGARNARPDRGPPAASLPASTAKSETRPTAAAAASGSSQQPGARPRSAAVALEPAIEPENWAEHGGWYQQDHAISYRPAGHKDWFITAWLTLTGPKAPKGDRDPLAAVFDVLTSKDAQGSCAKCHSVDDLAPKGRKVNFSPARVASKKGRFTTFTHEPHLGSMGTRGCLTCHTLDKDQPYLKSFEHGDPKKAVSNFKSVEKELCQTCHTAGKARQDCLTCHTYHVNGASSPTLLTKIPIE